MDTLRRFLVFGTVTSAVASLTAPSWAGGNYPNKPVRMVVAFSAGGVADATARIIADGLSRILNESFIVENRDGAGGTIGSRVVRESSPDGYTLLVNTSSFAVSPHLYSKPGYDAKKDFVPIAIVAAQPNVIAVHPSFPASTVAELRALLKSGEMSFASPGTGSTPHLTGENLFNVTWKAGVTHIPYRGGGPATTAVLSNSPPIGVLALSVALQHHKQGKLKILAVSSEKRVPSLPDIPTLVESGYPQIQDYTWVGVFAPAGTPPIHIKKINEAINQVINTPEYQTKFAAQALVTVGGTPDEFGVYLNKELEHWGRIVKAAKIDPS